MDFGRIGKAVAGQFSDRALDALRRNPQVRYVEDDGTVSAFAQTLPYGIDRVDADVLHDNGETGSGADIAIIDTGIDRDHEDLQANLGTGKDFTSSGGWNDDNGHGTHCAGIADAIDNSTGVVGVATEATLHAAKVLESDGSGTFSDVAAGIEWTANQGYDVGSLSLGASSSTSTLKDACQYAYDNGVLLVAAAGNSGPCTDCVGYPAAYSTVIAVSATDSNDDLASFSSTGPEVELAAPGVNVLSTYNDGGYTELSGTSMSCPHVSGAGAQLMANGYTNKEARTQLQDTAEDIGLGSNEQGNGLLDAENAVLGTGGGSDDCADPTNWPDGSGYSGYEYIQSVDMDGQFTKTSADNAHYDFTCPDVVSVTQGGSFTVTVEFEDDGYDQHYGNVYVDWDQNQDWSTATETQIFQNVSDDTVSYSATVNVPSDAATGPTLARVRLSWDQFYR
ncbi:MAG: S8 family peptidase [Halobaculum sp.]